MVSDGSSQISAHNSSRDLCGDLASRRLTTDAVMAVDRYLGTLHALQRPGGDTDEKVALFVDVYREAAGTAVATDPLGMAAELADLDGCYAMSKRA